MGWVLIMSYMKNVYSDNRDIEFYKKERVQYNWSSIDRDKDIHNGRLAINIKMHHLNFNPLNSDETNETIYEAVQYYFFDKAMNIAVAYGYSGFSTDGRSNGWLKPFTSYDVDKFLYKTHADTFEEYLEIEKFLSFKDKIKCLLEFIRLTIQYPTKETYKDYIHYIEEM
jgi:hypothetical protein